MYEADLTLLRCPKTGAALKLENVSVRAEDGEVLEAELVAGVHRYAIRRGIPRFVDDVSYNKSWDFKWRELDAGKAYNYRIIDKADPAYSIHDIFDRNGHDGAAWLRARGGVALDVGCGIGQYAVKLCLEQGPRKLIAMDLTGGVDIFRTVLEERYPALKEKILIVQASVFELPFADETFDFIMSLGVLMHTGDTRKAIDVVCRKLKDGGEINLWIYGSEPLAYEAIEPNREGALTVSNVKPFLRKWDRVAFWLRLFRRMNHDRVVKFLRFMSSDRVYNLSKRKGFRWIESVFPSVHHPDAGYRLINIYDGYVNNWQDTWTEHELFPILKRNEIALLGLSGWRVGLWGRKIRNFFPRSRGAQVSVQQTYAGVGYPKVGNTWIRMMVGRYIQLRYNLPNLPLGDRGEYEQLAAVNCPLIGEFTHFPLDWDTQTAADLSAENVVRPYDGVKVVLLVRHPLDTLVSSYMQERYRNSDKPYSGSLADFVRDPVFGLEKLLKYYRIWAESGDRSRVCLWRYEDAKIDSARELGRVLAFLDVEAPADMVSQAADFASFENMRAMERQGDQPVYASSQLPIFATGDTSNPNAFHVRRGEVGGYRAEFSAEDLAAFEAQIRRDMPAWYGYS